MNQSARRVRIYIILAPQCVADAAQCLDQAAAALRLELLTQMADKHVYDVGIHFSLIAPNLFEDLLAGEHLAGMAHKQEQELVLARGQRDG